MTAIWACMTVAGCVFCTLIGIIFFVGGLSLLDKTDYVETWEVDVFWRRWAVSRLVPGITGLVLGISMIVAVASRDRLLSGREADGAGVGVSPCRSRPRG
jgi:hypothetical protein